MSPCSDQTVPPEELKRRLIASLDPALEKIPETPEEAATRHEGFRKALEDFKNKRHDRTAILPNADFSIGTIEGVEEVRKRVDVLERKLNNLIDAISLNHVGHPLEGRSDACWSCKVVESAMGLRVAAKLMSDPGTSSGGENGG